MSYGGFERNDLHHDLAGEPFYPCGCHREIKFANVLEMGAILENETFYLRWNCECRADAYDHSFRVDRNAMRRLLGGLRPVVPYRAAPGQPLPLRAEQERLLRVFRWETEQLESVEEFLLFASRPAPRLLPE